MAAMPPPRPTPGVRRVTLSQIAAELGLPKMTVSLALRNVPGRVSEATRLKVQAVADRLGYRPDMMAQAMSSGRSHNIGVVVRPLGDFEGRILDGIHGGLYPEGWLPVLHYQPVGMGIHSTTTEAEVEIIHRLLDRRVDGLILVPADAYVPNAHFNAIWDRNIPLVTVDHLVPGIKADFVGTDDGEGGRQAALHLLQLGHRKIAQLIGLPRYATYVERRSGFEATLMAAGVTPVNGAVDEATADSAAGLIRALLTAKPRPTALFIPADTYAPQVYGICAELGLRIPQDVSVIGYADLALAKDLSPGLTTLAQNPYAIGVQAARQVLARCRGTADSGMVQIRLTPNLVIRGSTSICTG